MKISVPTKCQPSYRFLHFDKEDGQILGKFTVVEDDQSSGMRMGLDFNTVPAFHCNVIP